MKKKSKLLSAMAVILAVGCLAGCENVQTPSGSQSQSASPDTSKFVKLSMYCIGDQGGPYAKDVLSNFNKMLKDEINAELEPIMVSWADYKQKFPVVMASGEKFDMMFSANWILFDSEAPKGAYFPLNALLPIYAPKTYAQFPKEAWEQCSVDGKIYLFPKYGKEFTSNQILIREDLRKKYNLPEIKSFDDLGKYMEGIKKNEPELIPYNVSASVNMLETWKQTLDWAGDIGGRTSVTYKFGEPANIFSHVFTDEYEAFVKRQREWYNKGYWSSTVLSDKTNVNEAFKAGLSAVAINNIPTLANNVIVTDEKGFESKAYSLDAGTKIERFLYKQNGTAINVNSQNPERSVMMLEYLNQNTDAYDALTYGILDKTYTLTADGKTNPPKDIPSADLALLNISMGIGNPQVLREAANFPKDLSKMANEFDKVAITADLASFVFKPDKVSAELAALTNVYTQYQLPLNWGVVDPATGLKELRDKMKEAGIDKVIEEVKAQVAQYLK